MICAGKHLHDLVNLIANKYCFQYNSE